MGGGGMPSLRQPLYAKVALVARRVACPRRRAQKLSLVLLFTISPRKQPQAQDNTTILCSTASHRSRHV